MREKQILATQLDLLMLLYLTNLYKLVLNYTIKNYITPLRVIPLRKETTLCVSKVISCISRFNMLHKEMLSFFRFPVQSPACLVYMGWVPSPQESSLGSTQAELWPNKHLAFLRILVKWVSIFQEKPLLYLLLQSPNICKGHLVLYELKQASNRTELPGWSSYSRHSKMPLAVHSLIYNKSLFHKHGAAVSDVSFLYPLHTAQILSQYAWWLSFL